MNTEEALSGSEYNYRLQASLFKYETIQFNTVILKVTQETFLSFSGGSTHSQSLEMGRKRISLNNLAGKKHIINWNEGQALDDPSLNSRAI